MNFIIIIRNLILNNLQHNCDALTYTQHTAYSIQQMNSFTLQTIEQEITPERMFILI